MRVLLLLTVATSLAGCERGCLSSWLRDHGTGGERPPMDLGGTDCSDGLARCTGGHVEVSRAAHLPHPCTNREGRPCTCPWEPGPTCATGCASEGTEVVAPLELARVHLCRPDAPIVRPVLPGDPEVVSICDAPGTSCENGVLRACDEAQRPARRIGVCLHGCESRVGLSSDHGDAMSPDGAAAILCARLPR